jgi:hypothetical protein
MNPALAITVAVLALCAPAHAMDAASRANVADMMAFAAYNDVCEPPDRLLPTPGVGEALVMGRVILRLTEAEQQAAKQRVADLRRWMLMDKFCALFSHRMIDARTMVEFAHEAQPR